MRTKVLKSGNSLAIQIPSPVAQEFGLDPSSEVDVSLVRGTLVVHPLPLGGKHAAPEYRIAEEQVLTLGTRLE